MRNKCLIVCLLAAVLCGCRHEIANLQVPVERCADAPVALTSAAAFSINGQGYVFGGRLADGSLSNHLYTYDAASDTWTDLGETPLKARVRSRAVSVDDEVYIGLGFNGKVLIDSSYLADWWRWTPATNQWERLADYPSIRTVGPVMGSDGKVIYAAFGGKQNFERWIFRYDIATDTWLKIADGLARMASYPPRAHSACGGWCQGRFFAGAGYTRDGSSHFWVEAELQQDTVIWHRRATLSGKRNNCTSVSDDRDIYIAGGTFYGGTVTNGHLYDDIQRYDPQANRWTRLGRLPDGERENMISWVIGDYIYMGLGNDKRNTPCTQLYRIRR